MSDWQIVYDDVNDEMFALADTEYLLGWWETWPKLKWRQEVGQYRNTRGGWCHGQATHFQPLPAPPLSLPERATQGE